MKQSHAWPTILVFDSGIGGLSVYQEIKQCQPKANYLYLLDNQCFPYGEKSEAFVTERVTQLLNKILAKHTVSLIVIACNAASTAALLALREQLAVPIVGVVPAIKPAAQMTRNGVIGLLATKGTITRAYTQQLIAEFASHCQVELLGSAELVELAEGKLHQQSIPLTRIEAILQPWLQLATIPDVIILGCTHFPFLKEELAQVLPEQTQFIDSGAAVAHRVEWLLTQPGIKLQTDPCHLAYCTAINEKTPILENTLAQYGFTALQLLF